MSRYRGTKILRNSSAYYAPLRESRGKGPIHHYGTPVLQNPDAAMRSRLKSVSHIWSYGDRFYKLASKYYGDPAYWWVIAWYNSVPSEAHLHVSNLISIPVDIQEALRALGR